MDKGGKRSGPNRGLSQAEARVTVRKLERDHLCTFSLCPPDHQATSLDPPLDPSSLNFMLALAFVICPQNKG
jgi:hypothetical protein